MSGVEWQRPNWPWERKRSLAAVLLGLAVGAVGCAAGSPSAIDSPGGLVAPAGEIMEPPCPASAGCLGGFVVGETAYGISCHGVDATAVSAEILGRGAGTFQEARALEGIPAHLWLAVRGDLPCRPAGGGPLHYEWYLAQGEWSLAEYEEWSQRVAALTLPLDPAPGPSSAP